MYHEWSTTQMGLRDYLKATNEKAKANRQAVLERHDMLPEEYDEPKQITKRYKSRKAFDKDRSKMARDGWQAETVDNRGRLMESQKWAGNALGRERFDVTYVKAESSE